MVVIFTYTEQWSFVRRYEGRTVNEALDQIEDGFRGYAVVQDETKLTYHFK